MRKNKILIGILFLIIAILLFLFFNGLLFDRRAMNDRGGDGFIRWYKIKYMGDITSYEDAEIDALDNNYHDESFYNYALIMSDKYNYVPAYFDVYWALYCKQELNNDSLYSLDSLNEGEKAMALKYLLKAKNNGDHEAMEYLGIYYLQGKYFKKDSILGTQLIKESNKRFQFK
jgi:hypothetical protein